MPHSVISRYHLKLLDWRNLGWKSDFEKKKNQNKMFVFLWNVCILSASTLIRHVFSCGPFQASILICWNGKQCGGGRNNEGPSEGLISPAQVHPSTGITSCRDEGGAVGENPKERGIKVIHHLPLRTFLSFFFVVFNLFGFWGRGPVCSPPLVRTGVTPVALAGFKNV